MELVQDMMPPYPWPEYTPNFTLYEPLFKELKENKTDWYMVYKNYSHPLRDQRIPASDVFPDGRLVWGALIDVSLKSLILDLFAYSFGIQYLFVVIYSLIHSFIHSFIYL